MARRSGGVMEAILKFDLENPDDRVSHLRCIKATDMAIVLFEITRNLRRQLERKLEHGYPTQLTSYQTLDVVFEEIATLMDDNGINLEELIQ